MPPMRQLQFCSCSCPAAIAGCSKAAHARLVSCALLTLPHIPLGSCRLPLLQSAFAQGGYCTHHRPEMFVLCQGRKLRQVPRWGAQPAACSVPACWRFRLQSSQPVARRRALQPSAQSRGQRCRRTGRQRACTLRMPAAAPAGLRRPWLWGVLCKVLMWLPEAGPCCACDTPSLAAADRPHCNRRLHCFALLPSLKKADAAPAYASAQVAPMLPNSQQPLWKSTLAQACWPRRRRSAKKQKMCNSAPTGSFREVSEGCGTDAPQPLENANLGRSPGSAGMPCPLTLSMPVACH